MNRRKSKHEFPAKSDVPEGATHYTMKPWGEGHNFWRKLDGQSYMWNHHKGCWVCCSYMGTPTEPIYELRVTE